MWVVVVCGAARRRELISVRFDVQLGGEWKAVLAAEYLAATSAVAGIGRR
jgi:hypothetical protein